MKKFKNPNTYITMIFLVSIIIMCALSVRELFINVKSRYLDSINISYSKKVAVKNILKNIKNDTENINTFKHFFIESNGLFRKIIGQTYIEDIEDNYDVIKLKNGHLTFIYPKYDTTKIADNLINLSNELKEKNVELLYVQAPFKISKYDMNLPIGISDYTNQNTDEFLSKIHDKINYIDIREELKKDNLNQYDYFFKTDHHWKPELAFYAFKKVADELNLNYNFNISKDVTNIDNYNIEILENYFLGSQGKRVGKYYVGVDDISLISPKFNTNLTFEVPSYNIYRTGTFKDTVFEYEHINTKDYYNKNPYAVYTGGDFQFNKIINNLVKDKKVLLIRDSFACTFATFLSLAVHRLDIIDLRYDQGFSISKYVENYNIDLVLVLYNGGQFSKGQEMMFDFN